MAALIRSVLLATWILVSGKVIWVLRHISTKRLYRAEYAIKYTSNMQEILNGCTTIKMRKVGYVVNTPIKGYPKIDDIKRNLDQRVK